MWSDWFLPALPVIRVALATGGMYLTLLVFARWAGVRSFAEMSAFDIAVTIAYGSLLAAMVTEDPPLLLGMAAVATLYGIQLAVSRLRSRSSAVEAAVDNAPLLLMGPRGELMRENMRLGRVTEDDLRCHLRKANVADPATVQAVVMEGTGAINVLHGHDGALPANAWVLEGVRDRPGHRLGPGDGPEFTPQAGQQSGH